MDSFKDVKAFEMHMISGQHNVQTVASSMEHVKQCYVNKMKMSKPNALSTVSGQLMSSKKAHLVEYPDQLRIFAKPGWVLPVRKSFRFSENQKKILYTVFMQKFYHQVNMFPANRSVLCSLGNYRCKCHSRSTLTETVLF